MQERCDRGSYPTPRRCVRLRALVHSNATTDSYATTAAYTTMDAYATADLYVNANDRTRTRTPTTDAHANAKRHGRARERKTTDADSNTARLVVYGWWRRAKPPITHRRRSERVDPEVPRGVRSSGSTSYERLPGALESSRPDPRTGQKRLAATVRNSPKWSENSELSQVVSIDTALVYRL